MTFIKAHAFSNDFILISEDDAPANGGLAELAQRMCERHANVGADGLIAYGETPGGARMRLHNADGSYAEVSGNGVRCLAAWLARRRELPSGSVVEIETDAGIKRLTLLSTEGPRLTFRGSMGEPSRLGRRALDIGRETIEVVVVNVGNPQCVVLGAVTEERLVRLGARLSVHEAFPNGATVALAQVEDPARLSVLIWERGVGPTEASGTGACAAAVAASAYGGADRDVLVVSPGGVQRVEWTDEGLFLTGWAEVLYQGTTF
jgi:diaminopimelate epimerase